VNSVVSIAYYLAIPRAMIFQESQRRRPFASPVLVTAVAFVAMVAVVAIGVYPELLAHFPPLSTLVGR
jgi:NADH:ubiquinone oxidoreductase subunit 2 (subunit N)